MQKKLKTIFILFSLYSGITLGQTPEVKSIEGALRNSIDWYIQVTTDSINSRYKMKVESLDGFGFIEVHLLHVDDSVSEVLSIEDTVKVATVTHFKKLTFVIGMRQLITKVPSFYYRYKGIPILIYSEFEGYLKFSPEDLNKFSKKAFPRKGGYLYYYALDFIIELDEKYENGFRWKAALYKNTFLIR